MDVRSVLLLHLSPLIAAIQNIKGFLHVHGDSWTDVCQLPIRGMMIEAPKSAENADHLL